MADVEHSNLTGSSLHENKGVDTAAVDTVATAQGGVTVWKKVDNDNVTAAINSFANSLFHVRHEVSSGTGGGATSATTWNVRPLNTTKTNQISGASVSSNTVTLPAGTYWVEAWSVGSQTGLHKLRFRNTSDSTTAIVGLNGQAGNNITTVAPIAGQITIASGKNFQLQHYSTSSQGSGLGAPFSGGDAEVYADLRIWKLD